MGYNSFTTEDMQPFTYPDSYKILKEHFSVTNFPEQKEIFMCVGANGAGKSTLLANFYQNGRLHVPYLNADMYEKEVLAGIEEPATRFKMATITTTKLIDKCLNEGKSCCFETVFSHPSKLELIKKAYNLGYKITVFYVCTQNVQINIDRVEKRVSEGGHFVPRNKIVERYNKTNEQIKQVIPYITDMYFFDNSKDLTQNKQQIKVKEKEGLGLCL